MIATLTIESLPDGSVAFKAVYPSGFDVKDPAHQLAHMLTKYADSICAQLAEPVVDCAPRSIRSQSGPMILG